MKHLNITSLLARITIERDDELLQLTAAMSDGKKTSGNPMAICFKPATGDFIVLMSGRLGISAATLVNIMIEGTMRETLTPHQAAITRIPAIPPSLVDKDALASRASGRAAVITGVGAAMAHQFETAIQR